jgi:hypothetical protein
MTAVLNQTYSQNTIKSNFLDRIKNYNLSKILTADSIKADNGTEKIKREEVLGFIGDDYERLYIRFISVIQNPNNQYEYFAFGKTMVKENVCEFQGTIRITDARIGNSLEYRNYKQGFIKSDLTLFEDRNQKFTGYFKGELTSNFTIDKNGNLDYDALMFYSDDFSNNQFIGKWTSYSTKNIKTCNWGDYRIPESGDLDIGTAEFMVNDKYKKNGWMNYVLQNMAQNKAIVKPNSKSKGGDRQWWE